MDANTKTAPVAAETDLRTLRWALDTHLGPLCAGDSVHIIQRGKGFGDARYLVQHRRGQLWLNESDLD